MVRTLPETLWRIKGTLLIQLIIIGAGIVTWGDSPQHYQRVLKRFGFDYDLLTRGHLTHLFTGTWLQSTPGIEWSMIVLVFGGTVFLEFFAGTGAMLLTVIAGDWAATVLTALTTRVLAELGDTALIALQWTPDAGTSALAHAGYGAAVMLLPHSWLKFAVPLLVGLTSIQFSWEGIPAAIVHCWAAFIGALVGWFVLRPWLDRQGRLPFSDGHDRRTEDRFHAFR